MIIDQITAPVVWFNWRLIYSWGKDVAVGELLHLLPLAVTPWTPGVPSALILVAKPL